MKTQVVFRKFPEGDVIALFPNEKADFEGNIMSYQYLGQHGGACPSLALDLEVPSIEEAQELFIELKRVGYDDLEDLTFSLEKRLKF